MSGKILKSLKKALTPMTTDPDAEGKRRVKDLPKPVSIVEQEELATTSEVNRRKATGYVEMEVTSSKGKKYIIVVPQSYYRQIPKVWEWTDQRYRVADAISQGTPILNIATSEGFSRSIIYGWLEHPEFREHVDGITMEAGFANKRERIAGMSRLTHKIFDKLITELPHLKLTDKSVGPLLTAVAQYAKHIAQEKEEFVEASKVDQQTNLSGTVGVAAINLESQLQNQSEDTRRQLEEEWTALGDEIIRNLTGGK